MDAVVRERKAQAAPAAPPAAPDQPGREVAAGPEPVEQKREGKLEAKWAEPRQAPEMNPEGWIKPQDRIDPEWEGLAGLLTFRKAVPAGSSTYHYAMKADGVFKSAEQWIEDIRNQSARERRARKLQIVLDQVKDASIAAKKDWASKIKNIERGAMGPSINICRYEIQAEGGGTVWAIGAEAIRLSDSPHLRQAFSGTLAMKRKMTGANPCFYSGKPAQGLKNESELQRLLIDDKGRLPHIGHVV
ncbi:hypothetical protein [Streptomyces sp. NPDC055085]